MNASSNSLPAVVENAGVVIVLLAAEPSLDVVASMAMAAEAVVDAKRHKRSARTLASRFVMVVEGAGGDNWDDERTMALTGHVSHP